MPGDEVRIHDQLECWHLRGQSGSRYLTLQLRHTNKDNKILQGCSHEMITYHFSWCNDSKLHTWVTYSHCLYLTAFSRHKLQVKRLSI